MAVYTWRKNLASRFIQADGTEVSFSGTANPSDDSPVLVYSVDGATANFALVLDQSIVRADFPSDIAGINSFTVRVRAQRSDANDDGQDATIDDLVAASDTDLTYPIDTANPVSDFDRMIARDPDVGSEAVNVGAYSVLSFTTDQEQANAAALWADVMSSARRLIITGRALHSVNMKSDGPVTLTIDYVEIDVDYTPITLPEGDGYGSFVVADNTSVSALTSGAFRWESTSPTPDYGPGDFFSSIQAGQQFTVTSGDGQTVLGPYTVSSKSCGGAACILYTTEPSFPSTLLSDSLWWFFKAAGPVTPSAGGSLSLDVALSGAGVIPPIVRSGGGSITVDVGLAGAGGIPTPSFDGSGSLALDVGLSGAGELVTPSESGTGALALDVALGGAGAVVAPSFSGGPATVWNLTGLTAEGGTLDGTEVVTQQPVGMDLQWDGSKWAWPADTGGGGGGGGGVVGRWTFQGSGNVNTLAGNQQGNLAHNGSSVIGVSSYTADLDQVLTANDDLPPGGYNYGGVQFTTVALSTWQAAYTYPYARFTTTPIPDIATVIQAMDAALTVGETYDLIYYPPYVAAALDLGAVFIQDGNLDVVSNTFLTGGSDPVAEVDGVAAWAGDWSFTLAAPVSADCTVVGLLRRTASSGTFYPVVWDGSTDTTRVGLSTRQLANTKGGMYAYNSYGSDINAHSPKDEAAWVPVGGRGEDGVGASGVAYEQPAAVWSAVNVVRGLYGGTRTVVDASGVATATADDQVCGFAVFPTHLTDTQIQDLLDLLPSAL